MGLCTTLKTSCFSPASFTLVPLGRLILPIISYLSRSACVLPLSSFPCFTARLPFSQDALGGLCCRGLLLLPLCCRQGMQIQPGENSPLRARLCAAVWSSAHQPAGNSQSFSAAPWHGAEERGWDGHRSRHFWSKERGTETLEALLEQGQLLHSQKKLQTARKAHKPWHRQVPGLTESHNKVIKFHLVLSTATDAVTFHPVLQKNSFVPIFIASLRYMCSHHFSVWTVMQG